MLEEYMISVGYNEDEIKMIKNSYPLCRYSESTLLYNIKNISNYLRRNGLSNEEIVIITKMIPNIICLSTENIKIKIHELSLIGFNKIEAFKMVKNYPYVIEMSCQKIKNRIGWFVEHDFLEKDIIKIFTENTKLFGSDNHLINKRFNYFLEFGFTKEQIMKIFTTLPELINCNLSDINKSIDEFKKMGFLDRDIIKFATTLPDLLKSSKNIILDKFSFLLEFGFSDLDIINIIKRVPYILNDYYLKEIALKVDNFLSLGFSSNDLLFIICNNPNILLYPKDLVNNKYKSLKGLGFVDVEIIQMIKEFPLLLSYDINSIRLKVKYYRKIGLEQEIINNSRILRFNLRMVMARYKFFLENNKLTDNLNDLFLNDLTFFRKYKVSKKELMEGK